MKHTMEIITTAFCEKISRLIPHHPTISAASSSKFNAVAYRSTNLISDFLKIMNRLVKVDFSFRKADSLTDIRYTFLSFYLIERVGYVSMVLETHDEVLKIMTTSMKSAFEAMNPSKVILFIC